MTSLFGKVFKCISICLFLANIISAQESCTTPALENGFCVPYKDCPFINSLVQNYGSSEYIPKYYLNYISKSKCSRDNEPISLCCKLQNNYMKPIAPTAAPPPAAAAPPPNAAGQTGPRFTEDLDPNRDFNSQVNSEGIRMLNNPRCGLSGGDKVAGGKETDLAEFPWMALLQYDSPSDEFKCGASLISNRYVLTATHCVNKPVYQVIRVRLGEHDLNTNPDCRQKHTKNVCSPVIEEFGVEKIITHPRYNEKRHINDIALIKLDRDVEFKRHIKPVCLPITTKSFEVNSKAYTIAGWGATENVTRSSVLLKAAVPELPRSVCQNKYSANGVMINQKHICAGDLQDGLDSCKGDSGGPLISFNAYEDSKRYIQYGVVASGGVACNLTQKFPGIYTKVLTFLPWITNNIVE